MKVPFLDLKAQYTSLRTLIVSRVTQVLDSCQYINGPSVALLEKYIQEYLECEHAIGVSSGTDALLCSLMALDVGPGDEVITTPFTFFATVGSIWRLGARPVFVDIKPGTFNIDPAGIREDELEDARRVKAILPVHLFGQCADMTKIMTASGLLGDVPVVEDAAQALGASHAGYAAGTLGKVGCFSFFPSKNLGCAGDGGMIVTDDDELAEKIRRLRNHGSAPKYYHSMVGGNFRLDTIQAAILVAKLDQLEKWMLARQDNAIHYFDAFEDVDEIQLPATHPYNVHVYNQFVIRVRQRDELQAFLKERGIGTMVYYPLCLHQQECFASLGYKEGDFPVAEAAAREVLALPIYPELPREQQDYVIESVKAFFAGS